MRPSRGHSNRGMWTRKANAVEAAETPHSTKKSSKRVKDDFSSWTDNARVVESEACWDAHTFDASFFEDNAKIFEWDDYGALESLNKSINNSRIGVPLLWDDYLREVEKVSAAVDFDTRWSCNLAECADDHDRRKNVRRNLARRDCSESGSVVILGLSELKDGIESSNPLLNLPIDTPVKPSGWGEVESVSEIHLQNSPTQPIALPCVKESQMGPAPEDWWQSETIARGSWITGTGRPQCPGSYKCTTPSGWGDVQIDPPINASGRGDPPEEPHVETGLEQLPTSSRWPDLPEGPQETQLHRTMWGSCPSHEPNCSPGWDNLHTRDMKVDKGDIYGEAYGNRKQQQLYKSSYKKGCWKQKRANDTNNYNSSGRRTAQRPGRSTPSIYRVNRLHSKSQWQSTGACVK